MVSDGFFWLFKVPGWFSRFQVGFMVFQGSRLVFLVLWFFKVSGCFFEVPGGV